MIDIKKPIQEWTTEDLCEQKRRLNSEIEFMFMPPDISAARTKEYNNILNDAYKISRELETRENKK